MTESINEILNILGSLPRPEVGINLCSFSKHYWGIDSNGNIVYMIDAKQNTLPLKQKTRYIELFINSDFKMEIDNSESRNTKASGFVLRSNEEKHKEVFIRLLKSLPEQELDEARLLKYFTYLKDLFASEKKPSYIELQGMFGELFTMYILKINYGINISKYYQSEDKSKFDFSISDKKKIEVKSTLKQERIHHFLQHQLNTERYDIIVCSLMLQKDDSGMSLQDLVNECKELFSNDLVLLIHIETMCKTLSEEELKSIKFNYQYAKDRFRIYKAQDIPRIKEKNDDGVFNVEYDVDLVQTQPITMGSFIDWLDD